MQITSRYEALGIPLPDSKTICKGSCEGTGWFPIFEQLYEKVKGKLYPAEANTEQETALWWEAHNKAHKLLTRIKNTWHFKEVRYLFEKCDGWHIVKCPDCGGSGKMNNY